MAGRSRAAVGPDGVPERRDVYERLADELRASIESGEFGPGDRLPSTLDLMGRHGVANLTVRGAYRQLVEEGLVESVPKRGFYVRRPSQATWRLNVAEGRKAGGALLDAWPADVAAAGLTPALQVSVAIEDASAMVAGRPVGERLGLAAGSRVLVRRTIRSVRQSFDAGGAGADSLSDEYYPYDMVADTPLASPAPASAYAVLEQAGRRLRGHHDELRPRVASAEERRLLALPQVSVVLELARTAHDGDGVPVVVVHQVRRADGATFTYDIAYPGR